jgi:CDP-diacylglycerol--glycerol-3-phosphate 3-phosphatidyltransferase
MNIPTALTWLRLLLVLPICLLLLNPEPPAFLATSLLIIALLTDVLDGRIARKYNLESEFGGLLDAVVDTILKYCILIVLLTQGSYHISVVLLMLTRDFLIDAIRNYHAGQGKALKVAIGGRLKFVLVMISVTFVLINRDTEILEKSNEYIVANVVIVFAIVVSFVGLPIVKPAIMK